MAKKEENNFVEMGAEYAVGIAHCSDALIEFQINERMRMLNAYCGIKAAVDFRDGAIAAINYIRNKASNETTQVARAR